MSPNLENTDTPFKQYYVLLGLNIQEIIKTLFFPNSRFHQLVKPVRSFSAEYIKSRYTQMGPFTICDDIPS